jgi:hypothetical protein
MGFLSSLFGYEDKPEVTSKVSSIPEELKTYVDEAMRDTQALYKQRLSEGYQPYTGDTLAGFTPEQIASQEGLKSLVGTQVPFQQEALETFRQGAEKFTPETAKEFMSPYQRAVIDQEKDQAQRQYERTKRPEFEADAVRAGGMSGLGSRAAIESAEREDLQARLLADIETKGLQAAYQDAQNQFTNQKARERTVGTDVATAGGNIFSAGLAEQGLLKDIGAEKQGLAQSALDEAYYKFKQEKDFPEQQLARYQSSIYGNPLLSQPNYTQTKTPQQASMSKSLLGLGLSGLKSYGSGSVLGGIGKAATGIKSFFGSPAGASGGQVGGLPTLYRQTGGDLMDADVEYQTAKNRSRQEIDAANAAAAALNIPAPTVAAPTVAPPPPKPTIDPNKPQRKSVAENVAQIKGTTEDNLMAGLAAYLKPFGTPADILGAQTASESTRNIAAAKEELKMTSEEEKAYAKIKAERIKADGSSKKYKASEARQTWEKMAVNTGLYTLGGADGKTLVIDNTLYGKNSGEVRKIINKILAEAQKEGEKTGLQSGATEYIDKEMAKIISPPRKELNGTRYIKIGNKWIQDK